MSIRASDYNPNQVWRLFGILQLVTVNPLSSECSTCSNFALTKSTTEQYRQAPSIHAFVLERQPLHRIIMNILIGTPIAYNTSREANAR